MAKRPLALGQNAWAAQSFLSFCSRKLGQRAIAEESENHASEDLAGSCDHIAVALPKRAEYL